MAYGAALEKRWAVLCLVPSDTMLCHPVDNTGRVYIWLWYPVLGCANQYVSKMLAKMRGIPTIEFRHLSTI